MALLKFLIVCSVLNISLGYERRFFYSDNEEFERTFVSNDLRHCRPGDKVILTRLNPWIASLLTRKLTEIQNDNAVRQAIKMNENEEHHKRIMKHLAANPYSMIDQNSLSNLKIQSDGFSNANRVKQMSENDEIDHVQLQANIDEVFKPSSLDSNNKLDEKSNLKIQSDGFSNANRVKRMSENDEIDHVQLQANIDEVFKPSSLDSNNKLDENTKYDDPAFHDNINEVFGYATSARLLAQNVQNYDTKNHLDELTDSEELDSEGFDSTTKKTNLNEMILKNFGPELIDDDEDLDSTTENRFREIPTLLGKYNNMTRTSNHIETPTSKDTSLSGDGNLSGSTKNPDAVTAKTALSSSGGLASTSIPYLITLVLILLNEFVQE